MNNHPTQHPEQDLGLVAPKLEQIAQAIRTDIDNGKLDDPLIVGIHTGGAWLAKILHQQLQLPDPLGLLDISFYRDDFSAIGLHPQVKCSELPFEVDQRSIILVDDVLHTGRTIRAALNVLFDYGRPKQVSLAALAVRNGREIPIQADYCAMMLDLKPSERIQLHGPEPLELSIQTIPSTA